MNNFALDSSAKTAGVAITQNGKLIYESYLNTGLTHSESLLCLVNDAFCATRLSPKNIDLYSVTIGPGSFTGLRIGLALIKGLCMPFGTYCSPVSSLEALAECCVLDGTVLAAMDARRGEVYYAVFSKKNGVLTRITEDCADKAENALLCAEKAGGRLIITGNGAELCLNSAHNKDSCILYPQQMRFGLAGAVCRVGERMHSLRLSVSGDELSPDYHRFSQAERERLEKINKQPE